MGITRDLIGPCCSQGCPYSWAFWFSGFNCLQKSTSQIVRSVLAVRRIEGVLCGQPVLNVRERGRPRSLEAGSSPIVAKNRIRYPFQVLNGRIQISLPLSNSLANRNRWKSESPASFGGSDWRFTPDDSSIELEGKLKKILSEVCSATIL